MDSINFDNNVKAEKAKALRRYNRFRRIGSFFRAAEVCVAVLFILWTFTRLPFAVQISREFLSRIAAVISTPLFVFILGNCIVVALLTKSSVEENRESSASSSAETEIYEALVRSKPSDEEELLAEEEEIVYDDKEVIVLTEEDSSNSIPHASLDTSYVSDERKEYGRSKSDVCLKQSSSADDDHMVVIPEPSSLRRSETEEKCIRTHDDIIINNKSWEDNYEEDNLSNEEFQKTIEAFIAKQLMFRRQESLALVLHHPNNP